MKEEDGLPHHHENASEPVLSSLNSVNQTEGLEPSDLTILELYPIVGSTTALLSLGDQILVK